MEDRCQSLPQRLSSVTLMEALFASLSEEFKGLKIPCPDPAALQDVASLAFKLGLTAQRTAAEYEAAAMAGVFGARTGLALAREHVPLLAQRLDNTKPKTFLRSPGAPSPSSGLDLTMFGLPATAPSPTSRSPAPKPDPSPQIKVDSMDLDDNPSVSTPIRSQEASGSKYAQRKEAGKVTMSWGTVPPLPVHSHPAQVRMVDHSPGVVGGAHMWERPEQLRAALEERVQLLGDVLQEKHELGEVAGSFAVASQELVRAIGVLSVGEEDKEGPQDVASAHNLVLQGGHGADGEPERVRLDLTELKQCDLFAGQVVAVEGVNPYGTRLIAKRVWSDAAPPPPLRSEAEGGLTILVAGGPYTPPSDLAYEPLHDLLAAARAHRADVVLLLGPFLDVAHPGLGGATELPAARLVDSVWRRALREADIPCLLVPSTRDAHAEPILPQPAQPLTGRREDLAHVTSLRNPVTVQLNGVALSTTSADILWHLNRHAYARAAAETDASEPKRVRHLRALLQQRSLYPLFPPPPSSAFTAESADAPALPAHLLSGLGLPYLPDLLVVPSTLPPFVYNVDGVLCVNPGRLVRHEAAGTYALIHVHPQPPGHSTPLAARARVDIIRI